MLLFAALLPTAAQDLASKRLRESSLGQIQSEAIREQLESAPRQNEPEERRRARILESQFLEKAKRFADAWDRLVKDYNSKRAFDIKKAKEVSKAFRELEKSQGWVSMEPK
jgi:hypothetical protein